MRILEGLGGKSAQAHGSSIQTKSRCKKGKNNVCFAIKKPRHEAVHNALRWRWSRPRLRGEKSTLSSRPLAVLETSRAFFTKFVHSASVLS